MGPPQKTGTYLCYLYCSNAAAYKNKLFQKASFKRFARVFPMLTGQGYEQKRQEQERAYRYGEGNVSGSQIGHWQNYALVQGFCFQDNTLLIFIPQITASPSSQGRYRHSSSAPSPYSLLSIVCRQDYFN